MAKRMRLVASELIRLPDCGYAVHIQELSSEDYEECIVTSPPSPTDDDDEVIRRAKQRANIRHNTEWALRMVQKVSTIVVPKDSPLGALKDSEWECVTLQQLIMDNSDVLYTNWMSPGDQGILRMKFGQFHSVTEDKMAQVSGKAAVPVSPV
jgi:hypothetical protein